MSPRKPAAASPAPKPKAMLVAGVMSGTSADGIDVALTRIAPGPSHTPDSTPHIRLLAHRGYPYRRPLRQAVLAAMGDGPTTTAELARLNWALGAAYAEAIADLCAHTKQKPALVGLHGQTIYHQSTPAPYAGRPVRATCQTGEPAVLTEALRIPVVSDLRPADLAAGGQGAPLVPMLDWCLFRHRTRNRVLLNLGGIANLTAIPAGATLSQLLALDTGPANMVVDAVMEASFRKPYDRHGRAARRGRILTPVVQQLLRSSEAAPFFTLPPPKSCGREQFGAAFTHHLMQLTAAAGGSETDAVATATELTVASLYDAYTRFVWPHLGQAAPLARATDLIAAGGGVHNDFLMAQLAARFTPLGVKLLRADDLGLPAQAKEAVAFALLAWLRWHHLPGNVPSATGASRATILGKVSLP